MSFYFPVVNEQTLFRFKDAFLYNYPYSRFAGGDTDWIINLKFEADASVSLVTLIYSLDDWSTSMHKDIPLVVGPSTGLGNLGMVNVLATNSAFSYYNVSLDFGTLSTTPKNIAFTFLFSTTATKYSVTHYGRNFSVSPSLNAHSDYRFAKLNLNDARYQLSATFFSQYSGETMDFTVGLPATDNLADYALRVQYSDATQAPYDIKLDSQDAFFGGVNGKVVNIKRQDPAFIKPNERTFYWVQVAMPALIAAGFVLANTQVSFSLVNLKLACIVYLDNNNNYLYSYAA